MIVVCDAFGYRRIFMAEVCAEKHEVRHSALTPSNFNFAATLGQRQYIQPVVHLSRFQQSTSRLTSLREWRVLKDGDAAEALVHSTVAVVTPGIPMINRRVFEFSPRR